MRAARNTIRLVAAMTPGMSGDEIWEEYLTLRDYLAIYHQDDDRTLTPEEAAELKRNKPDPCKA